MGSRKVPVHVPPCQMLNTATPVLEYQLSRMLRELPRTSKKISPSRGNGAASDADMLPMMAPPEERLSTSVQSILPTPHTWPTRPCTSGLSCYVPGWRGRPMGTGKAHGTGASADWGDARKN